MAQKTQTVEDRLTDRQTDIGMLTAERVDASTPIWSPLSSPTGCALPSEVDFLL